MTDPEPATPGAAGPPHTTVEQIEGAYETPAELEAACGNADLSFDEATVPFDLFGVTPRRPLRQTWQKG